MPDSLATRLEGLRGERIRASKQWNGVKFQNPTGRGAGIKGNPIPIMTEFLFARGEREPDAPLPVIDPLPALRDRSSSTLRITWLGHSTLLLEQDGVRVLTDPVFGMRASPVSFAGPKRFHAPPLPLEALPELDAVLLSHDHYDHLCAGTMAALAKRDVPFITSLGVGARLEALGVRRERIAELDWWERTELSKGMRITATPAEHFSGRSAGDRNLTLWSSFVLTTANHRLFFSGDTGFTETFGEIGEREGPFDVVMLEIGAYHPSWGTIHLGPENALRAHALLTKKKPAALLPVHWGTFNLALHAWHEPAETIYTRARTEGVRLFTPRLGETFEPPRVESLPPWWRALVRKPSSSHATEIEAPQG